MFCACARKLFGLLARVSAVTERIAELNRAEHERPDDAEECAVTDGDYDVGRREEEGGHL